MRKWLSVLQEAAMSFAGDNAPRLGAALAYYTVFSIAPLILITITLAGAIFGEEAARGQVFLHTAQILFFGAELTQAYSRRIGSMKGEEEERR